MIAGLVALRIVHFWATAVMVGGGGLSWLLGPQRPASSVRLLRIAAIAAGLTGLAWLAFTMAGVIGANDAVLHAQDWRDFLMSPFGPPWAILVGLSLVACLLVCGAAPKFFCGLGMGLTLDQAWLGHAAAGTGMLGVVAIVAYVAHVVAGFAWVGTLTMLCVCLRTPEALRTALAIVSDFGFVVVALIIASGCVNAAEHVGGFAELTTTVYGRVLVTKIALVAAMLVPAAFNRREKDAKDPGALRVLAISVGTETLFGLVVLALAAVLGITEPPA